MPDYTYHQAIDQQDAHEELYAQAERFVDLWHSGEAGNAHLTALESAVRRVAAASHQTRLVELHHDTIEEMSQDIAIVTGLCPRRDCEIVTAMALKLRRMGFLVWRPGEIGQVSFRHVRCDGGLAI